MNVEMKKLCNNMLQEILNCMKTDSLKENTKKIYTDFCTEKDKITLKTNLLSFMQGFAEEFAVELSNNNLLVSMSLITLLTTIVLERLSE